MPTYQNRQSRPFGRREQTDRERRGTDTNPPPAPQQVQGHGASLDPATRSALEPHFGHSLDNIRIFSDDRADQLSQDFDAEAFTVGQDIFFAQGNYDPGSEWGRHLLTHEVAHAVQQRGTRAKTDDLGSLPVAGRHSHSESEAHTATHAVTRGQSAPALTAGAGPVVSRWEAGEHKHAVDDSLPEEMKGKIKLANGMMVTPGEITAMMGDLYGKYDKKGNFDPAESFKQMNNADPKEMAKLVQLIDDEAKSGAKLTDASEFEKATRNRASGTDSYLELASKNSNHFSAPTADGTDNNMGAYNAFHKMALEAAQKGDMETAKAMEASGDHFLTDRFSAGHNFDKEAAMKASGHDRNGVLANMAVKTAHDDMNENGIDVHDAKGEHWKAYGDGKWDDPNDHAANAENRKRTGAAVASSWDELAKVHAGTATAADLEKKGGVAGSVPEFDIKNQERAESTVRHTSLPGMLWDYGGTLPDAALGKAWRLEGHIENGLSDAWDWTKDKAGQAWHAGGELVDWGEKKAGQAWDAGGKAVNWAEKEAEQGLHTAGKAVDWAEKKTEKAVDWTLDEAKQGAHAVGDAAKWTGGKIASGVSAGVGAVEDAGSWVGGKAKDLWNWAF